MSIERAPRRFVSAAQRLHPDTQLAHGLLIDGHGTEAVRRAAQRFINRVAALVYPEEDERGDQQDGVPLMAAAFAREAPLLSFSRMSTRVERNEHDGYRNLAIGLALGLRNVATHADEYPMDHDGAFEWLAFISAMHRRLDGVDRVHRAPREDSESTPGTP